ncbi:hypothetical protein OIU77_006804 [Salix suchowensis]|uniref:F-box domain-containing protein n=1 Tax=Salix suchowensis TaxID=1278906 RepID=A0ABQ9ALY1_9ROSI|nr:hypothetical protein OIU77_006804 [Salix suchowensis]KAJ6349288.1 hypothetical protein OIU77_006804 [Salix suchowensis]KAJ6349289.1 hypothetical protein OIU77_006804 [Salix suchowensis]KAJ6349290.1 hypothetical protein OIU77_006804 [Salix suchowensis]
MKKKKKTRSCIYDANAALSSDDILCEILLRVPPETVFKLIIVSKRWLHFICSPVFCQHYLKRWPLAFRMLGFFVCNNLYLGRGQNGVRRPRTEPAMPLLSTCKEGDDLKFSKILNQFGYFIDSSNGLLLCGRHPKRYFVWNPITKQHYKIPKPRVYFEDLCMAFLAEDHPSVDMCYKVIRAKCDFSANEEMKTVPIETFNSKTSTWNFSTLSCAPTLSLCSWSVATVVKGVVHWYAAQRNLAVYDPQSGERHLSSIKLPGSIDFEEHVLGESFDGRLQYGWSCKAGLEIWVLEKEEAGHATSPSDGGYPDKGWKLRYRLNFKTMWKKNPTSMTKFCTRDKETQILSFLHRNSRSVCIRSGPDIFIVHLLNQKVEVVLYNGRGSSISWDFSRVAPYFRPDWPHSSLCLRGKSIA